MLNFAIQTARDAGRVLADRLGRALQVSNKGDIDLVTEADLASEKLIIERIKSHYPRHAILAEESGVTSGTEMAQGNNWKWIIDPLDGTTNYAHGYPCFCVSIAVERAGAVEIGVVYDPMRDEVFAAERGQGATLNGRAIKVSSISELDSALVCTGFPYDVRERQEFSRHFTNFTMQTQAVRRDGSAALDLCYVACGRFDGFWEDYRLTSRNAPSVETPPPARGSNHYLPTTSSGLQKWDVAGGVLITREAGGVVTSQYDLDLDISETDVTLVASNGLVHRQMIELLAVP